MQSRLERTLSLAHEWFVQTDLKLTPMKQRIFIRSKQGRRIRGGGSGGNLSPQPGSCGDVVPHFGLSMSFIFLFLFVLHVNLGLFQKKKAKSGEFLVLYRAYLGTRETFAPPPPNFKAVPAPLDPSAKISTLIFTFHLVIHPSLLHRAFGCLAIMLFMSQGRPGSSPPPPVGTPLHLLVYVYLLVIRYLFFNMYE